MSESHQLTLISQNYLVLENILTMSDLLSLPLFTGTSFGLISFLFIINSLLTSKWLGLSPKEIRFYSNLGNISFFSFKATDINWYLGWLPLASSINFNLESNQENGEVINQLKGLSFFKRLLFDLSSRVFVLLALFIVIFLFQKEESLWETIKISLTLPKQLLYISLHLSSLESLIQTLQGYDLLGKVYLIFITMAFMHLIATILMSLFSGIGTTLKNFPKLELALMIPYTLLVLFIFFRLVYIYFSHFSFLDTFLGFIAFFIGAYLIGFFFFGLLKLTLKGESIKTIEPTHRSSYSTGNSGE